MAEMTVITCPSCKRQLKGPADIQGKKVRCKGCNTTFTVPVTAAGRPGAGASPVREQKVPLQSIQPAKQAPDSAKRSAQMPQRQDPGSYVVMDEEEALKAMIQATSPDKTAGPKASGRNRALDEDPNPYRVTDIDLASRCPHCAKEMDEGDIICLNCGYNTQTRRHATTKRVYYTTGQDRFLWLLPGIVCVLIVFALIGFDCWFVFALEGYWHKMDKNWENTSFSMGIRVWVCVLSAFGAWIAGKFAFKRLILNPSPPEIEKH